MSGKIMILAASLSAAQSHRIFAWGVERSTGERERKRLVIPVSPLSLLVSLVLGFDHASDCPCFDREKE